MFKRIARKGLEIASPWLFSNYMKDFAGGWQGKKSAFTLSFDIDYPADVNALPKLLETLDSYQISASFACVGKWVEKYPKHHQQILEKKHEIINHTYSHPNNELLNQQKFSEITPQERENEISFFEEITQHVLDYMPKGFRAPHFGDLNSQHAYEILEQRGYLYSSSTCLTTTVSKGLPYRPSRHDYRKSDSECYRLLELPVFTCPEHYFSVFDTWHTYHTGAHNKTGDFLRLFEKALRLGLRFGAYVNTYFDPRDVSQNKEFEQSLEFLKNQDVWIQTSEAVARYWNEASAT